MFDATLNPLSLIFFLFAALYLSAKKVDPKLLVALLVGGVLLFSSSQNQDTVDNDDDNCSGSGSGFWCGVPFSFELVFFGFIIVFPIALWIGWMIYWTFRNRNAAAAAAAHSAP